MHLKFLLPAALLGIAALASANSISLPGGTLAVPGSNSSGVSFVYSGTLTQADTLSLTATGTPCLQTGPAYCTNAAGVLTVAGIHGPGETVGSASGFSATFNGTSGGWDFGALVLEISSEGAVQIFPADTANGLNSPTPPTSLVLPQTSLAALGFGSFSITNPTITFLVADSYYPDNTGSLTLTQAQTPTPTPEPATIWLLAPALAALGCIIRRRKAQASICPRAVRSTAV